MKPQTKTDAMGFGTLFIGYFFVLNFPYCEFTDAIAAALMLYGLYKLSAINEWFKLSFYSALCFATFGIFELATELYGMFSYIAPESIIFLISALLRHVTVCAVTAFMMLGIRDVAREVGLKSLAEKSARGVYVSLFVYLFSVLLESTLLASFVPAQVLAFLYVLTTLATLTLIIFNLTCIYSAYMRICMPDDKEMEEKESKLGFVNAFRRHEEEKSREYAEYKLEKMKKKQENKNKGKK